MDPTSSQVPPSLPVLDNPSSRAVHAVLDLVQRERGTWLAPRIARLHSPEVRTTLKLSSKEHHMHLLGHRCLCWALQRVCKQCRLVA